MYLPKHFETTDIATLHAFIRQYPFAALVTRSADDLTANHIPFMLDSAPAPYGTLLGHVARANPVWRSASDDDVLVIFQGPNAFISPSWYPTKQETGQVVPTWNYAVAHVYGRITVHDNAAWVRSHVEALTHVHEDTRETPWHVTDAPADYIDRLVLGIVGIEIPIGRVLGKWKMSQNRSDEDRRGVVEGLCGEQSADARATSSFVAAAQRP
jgi:transcriptional regulator